MKKQQTRRKASPGRAAPTPQKRPAAAGTPRRRRAVSGPKVLEAVLKRFSASELARICGVSRQAVSGWTAFPSEHALAVEKASGGELTKEFLAPNFYPRPG